MKLADSAVGRRIKDALWERSPDGEPLVPGLCGSDLLIAIFDDPNNRSLETAPTRDHKVTKPNVCGIS